MPAGQTGFDDVSFERAQKCHQFLKELGQSQ